MSARALACLAAALALAGCGDRAGRQEGVAQTHMPGVVTAGGKTSGEIVAANSPAAAVQPGPAGTPGIPQGSGGNTGGAATGGSVPDQTHLAATTGTAQAAGNPGGPGAAVLDRPAVAASAGLPPVSGTSAVAVNPALSPNAAGVLAGDQARARALPDADRDKLELAAVTDAVAARWRRRAASEGWATHAATPIVVAQPATAARAPDAQPQGRLAPEAARMPIASEKLGTAGPSPDVKASRPPSDPGVGAKPPTIASPRP